MTLRLRDGVAGLAGLQHCGSVWSCSMCSAPILTHRALEIGAVLGQAVAEGHALAFGTFTMSHRPGQPLRMLWDAAAKGWRRAISGKSWLRDQAEAGCEGWVRVWETTDGRNGWHVHVHFVVVLPGDATQAHLDRLAGSMFGRWSAGLVAAGLAAPRLVGQDWHLATGPDASGQLAEYLFKIVDQAEGQPTPPPPATEGTARSLGLELVHTQPGRARSDLRTRPVWTLIDAIGQGDLGALRRWHEWEAGSKGRKQVGWSSDIRERFAPAMVEATDEQIADQEHGTADDDLVYLTRDGYAQLVGMPWVIPELLEAAEAGGLAALAPVLDRLGVPYLVVERPR